MLGYVRRTSSAGDSIGLSGLRLLRHFDETDIFVQSRSADCRAVVQMKSTAAAVPVINTNVDPPVEAVRVRESGMFVRPGASGTLRGALAETDLRSGRAA